MIFIQTDSLENGSMEYYTFVLPIGHNVPFNKGIKDFFLRFKNSLILERILRV